MKIDWDTEKGALTIEFKYAYVSSRCTNETLTKGKISKNWSSSSDIVDKAIRQFLKGTDIRWTNSSRFESGQVLTLTKRFEKPYKNISMKKMNDILFQMDKYITSEIYNLINQKDNI